MVSFTEFSLLLKTTSINKQLCSIGGCYPPLLYILTKNKVPTNMSDVVNSGSASGQDAAEASMAVVLEQHNIQPPTLPPIDGMVPPSLPPIDNNDMTDEDTKPSANSDNKRKQPPEEDNGDDTPKPKKKRNRAICSTEGCNNQVVNDGVCIKHGAQTKICSYEGKIYSYHISYNCV